MLKIWGRTNSINVQKVMWTVAELGLEHERIDAGGRFGQVDQDWFTKMNPNRRIPVIDDDGFTLWESHTIVRYLTAKHAAGSLWPEDPQKRAEAEKWMDWSQSLLNLPLFNIFAQLVRVPQQQRNMQVAQHAGQVCAGLFTILNVALEGKEWLAGDSLTIGDLAVGPYAHRWLNLPVKRPDAPHLTAWYERLGQRPAFAQHVALPLS